MQNSKWVAHITGNSPTLSLSTFISYRIHPVFLFPHTPPPQVPSNSERVIISLPRALPSYKFRLWVPEPADVIGWHHHASYFKISHIPSSTILLILVSNVPRPGSPVNPLTEMFLAPFKAILSALVLSSPPTLLSSSMTKVITSSPRGICWTKIQFLLLFHT